MAGKFHINVDVYLAPAQLDEMQLKDRNIVVIDVLRASTTIATALQNGAKEIIPVGTIESAVKISGNLFGDVTLRAGERNGKMIEGFNLGNSPLEYTEKRVKGKSIILLTTNGSGVMVKGRYAKNLVVAGFVNISMVVDFLASLRSDITIICAGQDGVFCLEDAVCAGKILNRLDREIDGTLVLNDAATAAVSLDTVFGKNVLKVLKTCNHGKFLTEIGFAPDLKICADIDTIPLLPVLVGSVVKARKESRT